MSIDETNTQSADDPDADIDRDGERILSAEGAGKRFSGLQALDDVDITVNRGEIISLTGLSGVGKTTLFNCISGAFPPTSGIVRLGGEVISDLSAHKVVRAGLARTLQIARPLEGLTVIENAMVGACIHACRRSEVRETAVENFKFIGLVDKAKEEAGELTVGAQKRLELAHAVSTWSEILPLDEIMAGLTLLESSQVFSPFRQLRERGMSLLIIEYGMKAIMNISNYMKVLDQGKGIAFDAPRTMAEDDHITETYIGGFGVDV